MYPKSASTPPVRPVAVDSPSKAGGQPGARAGSVPGIRLSGARAPRRNRLESDRFVDDWRATLDGSVLAVVDFPPAGLPLKDSVCRYVMCTDALDSENFDRAIAELARVTKQEGVVLLSCRLGHNPIAGLGRNRRFVHGSPGSFQRPPPLGCTDIDRLRAHFGGVQLETFDILTFALAMLENALGTIHPAARRLCAPLWPAFRALDRLLLRWRPARRYGCTAVAVLKWPRRHDRD